MARDRSQLILPVLLVIGLALLAGLGLLWRSAELQRASSPAAARELYDQATRWFTSRRDAPALDALNRALDIDPGLVDAYALRGQVHLRANRLDDAIDDFGAAIDLDPTIPSYFEQRGSAHEANGSFEQAEADYTRAVDLQDETLATGPLMRRAWLRILQAEYAAAAADLESVLQDVPDFTFARHRLAWARWGLGDYEGAVAAYDQAIEGGDAGLHTWFGRGASSFHAGNDEAAIRDLARAASMRGWGRDYAHLYLWLARARAGRSAEANATLEAEYDSRNHQTAWSRALQAFLIGRQSEEAILGMAREAGDPTRRGEMLCEAGFYAGTRRLIEGDPERGRELLTMAVETGIRAFYEYHGAEAELRRGTKASRHEGTEGRQ